ncbi:MAG: xanthan lyase [Muribaculaceae bacterium]|jgi:hypothetical protein|nr:xanthan lyase [Muribaculaceae bacterium]
MQNIKIIRTLAVVILSGVLGCFSAMADSVSATEKAKIQTAVESTVPANMGIGKVRVKTVSVDKASSTISVNLGGDYADVPFTRMSVDALKAQIAASSAEYSGYNVNLMIDSIDINKYFPEYTAVSKRTHDLRFISPLDPSYNYSSGLNGYNIVIWQSHGWYFESSLNRWQWQRARMYQTVEDLYTQSYVMPYLMPMLENAGAYVFSPRERDTNINEVIVDNDGGNAQLGYKEHNNGGKWKTGDSVGFAYKRAQYEGYQNPFREGTFRYAKTTNNLHKYSTAQWNANIPEDGMYAVYISYKTIPGSVSDAVYTINSANGQKMFTVNQQMGGGTWLYLGHYYFKKGLNNAAVELSNYSTSEGYVTADAVKIGGGMGNIARKVEGSSNDERFDEATTDTGNKSIKYDWMVSNHPRYTEGARYFMQWAGIPDTIYSPFRGVNDYKDDYQDRGSWVNYLAGGSVVLPQAQGLHIPIDLSMAFHSDAGTTKNDDVIGSLGIYYSNHFGNYNNGTPRILSRDFTNIVLTNITNDVRRQFKPDWKRRGMWDQRYFEARQPEVPAMLLELLSHENFADMKYGLDPNFRFTVSRAIYKGMVQFLSKRDGHDYKIEPLPINSFAITPLTGTTFNLTWKATKDTLCDKADATRFAVLERIGDGGFKQIALTSSSSYTVNISDNLVHSYQIIAMNDGGRSFPSESLALGVAKDSKGTVMVVNDFTRVSAPDWFDSGEMAGFYSEKDHGVPYIKDISYIGQQYEFRRKLKWTDDDAAGFGASRSNYETKVIAGNTFDYPYIHGAAIMNAGYSFVSSSVQSVCDGGVRLGNYKMVDLIVGKQKEVPVGSGKDMPARYKAFPTSLRDAISAYCKQGGDIFVSGAFVASDIWDRDSVNAEEKAFAQNVLGYKWRVCQAAVNGEAYCVPTVFQQLLSDKTISFNTELNKDMYCVESPDAILPFNKKVASTTLRYKENNLPAAMAMATNYKTYVMGFPFETIKDGAVRDDLMKQVLDFFKSTDNLNK